MIVPELTRYGYGEDELPRRTRSYLFHIMDNLADVEAWLATIINPERLNHPKTIWQAFDRRSFNRSKWMDDPGEDLEDDEEYYGFDDADEDDDFEETIAAKNKAIAEADAKAAADAEKERAEKAEKERADAKAAADKAAADAKAAADKKKARPAAKPKPTADDDADDDDAPFPNMPYRDITTIRELEEYIEEAMRRGVNPNNRFYINVDEEKLHVASAYFRNDEGPGHPPVMVGYQVDTRRAETTERHQHRNRSASPPPTTMTLMHTHQPKHARPSTPRTRNEERPRRGIDLGLRHNRGRERNPTDPARDVGGHPWSPVVSGFKWSPKSSTCRFRGRTPPPMSARKPTRIASNGFSIGRRRCSISWV